MPRPKPRLLAAMIFALLSITALVSWPVSYSHGDEFDLGRYSAPGSSRHYLMIYIVKGQLLASNVHVIDLAPGPVKIGWVFEHATQSTSLIERWLHSMTNEGWTRAGFSLFSFSRNLDMPAVASCTGVAFPLWFPALIFAIGTWLWLRKTHRNTRGFPMPNEVAPQEPQKTQ